MAGDRLGALPRKRATVGQGIGTRQVDPRFVRGVVRYRDLSEDGTRVAIDELECGHQVPCSRTPGGKLVLHAEECSRCLAAVPA